MRISLCISCIFSSILHQQFDIYFPIRIIQSSSLMKNTNTINKAQPCLNPCKTSKIEEQQHRHHHRSCDNEEIKNIPYCRVLDLTHFHSKSPPKLKRYSSQASINNFKLQKQNSILISDSFLSEAFQLPDLSSNYHQKTNNKSPTPQYISNQSSNNIKRDIPKILFQLKQTVSTECQENIQMKKKSKEVPNFLKKKNSIQMCPSKAINTQQIKSKTKINDQYPKREDQKLGISKKKITLNNFQIIKKLGEGKFGKVYLVKEKLTNFIAALKIVDKRKISENRLLNQFIRELKIQTFLQHPYITKIYGFFDDIYTFYILLENGCMNLYSIMQKQIFTQEQTSFIIRNLLETLNFMHDHNILHRDIKPENILVIHGHVKLCDFGWATNKKSFHDLRETFCGTPLYLSPQILKGQKYDEKVDLWAIGILTYQILLGGSPFEIELHNQIDRIVHDKVKFPSNSVSGDFKEFILTALQKNPKKRKSGKQLLSMKFITNYSQLETCQKLCNGIQQNCREKITK